MRAGALFLGIAIFLNTLTNPCLGYNLLDRYPSSLKEGDANPAHGRSWEFGTNDIFRVSEFKFKVGDELQIEAAISDVGIGHCVDGAVWALVIPRAGGGLKSSASKEPESIAHVWLRFHPAQISKLFPPETVFEDGQKELVHQMRAIAHAKFMVSWHAGDLAMIPRPQDLTVDIDLSNSVRRAFLVDQSAATAKYLKALESRALKVPPPITEELAASAFDQLWKAFDEHYAMFVLRPEVDWTKLRDEYRPKAIVSKSAYEFADIAAQMLRPLRDLHVWLTLAEADVPVFNRPRSANFNPAAIETILGKLQQAGRNIRWTVTTEKIGYIFIGSWSDSDIPTQFERVLEEMRDTRGLIIDVRPNGGGSEALAEKVAGRFLEKKFTYAYSQFRNGPKHNDLTNKKPRTISPSKIWRYNRPVVLLIGQRCMSSNESFIAMMSGAPNVTTMGDHTCGSSGNPQFIPLPLELRVSVPQWIDYLPDGTALDEKGFQPRIPFKPEKGSFDGDRDDLLSAALQQLR